MAINMDAVLELSAKVDGMSQLLQLERSLADVKGELGKYDKANKDAGLSTKQMGLMMTAASFAGNLLADAAQNLLANLQSMVTSTIQSGLAFEQTETRIRMLSEGYGEFDAVQGLITKNAALLGQSQVQAANGFADIYARLRPLGIGLEDINAVYLGFNSLAMQSGTTAEAASGAFMQLSQALGSGTLRGDEFNSVAEQVPGILTKVAEVMGQPVGALRGLAAEGKITSTVVIEAMQRAAAEGGANLEQLSGSAAMSVGRMNNAFTDLQAKLGKELVPVIAAAANELTRLAKFTESNLIPAIQRTVTEVAIWQTVLEQMANNATFEFNALGVALQNVAKDGDLVKVAISAISATISGPLAGALANTSLKDWLKGAADEAANGWALTIDRIVDSLNIVDGTIKTIMQTSLGPLGTILAGMYDTVKAFIGAFPELSGYSEQMLKSKNEELLLWNQQIAKTSEAKAAAAELNAQAERQRKELEAQAGAKERLKDLTEKMNADYALMNDSLEQQTAEYEMQIDAIADVRDLESTRLNLLQSQLERQLKKATSLKEEEQILLQLRNVELRNAELNYQAALTAIDQGIFKVQLERDQLDLKLQQAQAALRLAQAENLVTTALKLAVDTTYNALNLANQQIDRAVDHGKVLAANAALQRQQAVETAQAKYEQALLAAEVKYTKENTTELVVEAEKYTAEIERATTHVIKLHGELREVDRAVVRISRGWMSVQNETLLAAEAAYNYQQFIQDTAQRIQDLRDEGTNVARNLADAIRASLNESQLAGVDNALRALRKMAVGGYVTSPTAALIGEGGEPEYVIPASKMASASTAFLSGSRGASVLQPAAATSSGPMAVNIQTGPVMAMGGQQYVSKSDLSMAVTQAVQQTMQLLIGNSDARQMVGI